MDLSPLSISIKTSALATMITFLLGLYAARFIQRQRRWRGIIDGILTLPSTWSAFCLEYFRPA